MVEMAVSMTTNDTKEIKVSVMLTHFTIFPLEAVIPGTSHFDNIWHLLAFYKVHVHETP